MKFDVVLGNPPYNKGMDIDFVNLGFELCNRYCLMITPAKWQTADDNQRIASKMSYGEFRKKVVPYIAHVVFYPCCKDIFDILQVDGITYYIIDKQNKHEKAIVENKCKHIAEFNSKENRSIRNRESLLNIGNEIVENLGVYKKFTFESYCTGKYCVIYNTQAPGGNLSTIEHKRKTLFIGDGYIIESRLGEIDTRMSAAKQIVFKSDEIEKCKSFKSWMDTRFTRFFTAINASKLTGILTNDCFRFVPAPPNNNWDHIYTDKELYEYFKLPQKYIEIIESIVKERGRG